MNGRGDGRAASRVGLVLGGGGITGAAYELATLLAIEMATGWNPDEAEVVVGTSAGAFVASTVRGRRLSIDSLVRPPENRREVADRIRGRMFQRGSLRRGVGRWMRHGLVPGLRSPGLSMLLGMPAPYSSEGIGDWVAEQVGELADRWPDKPTAIVAFEVEGRRRVPFGTEGAPDTTLRHAVAASAAVPVLFQPYRIGDRHYVDGGVMSGTHADLLLAAPEPLDLVLVVAPLAAESMREGARVYEHLLDFDRVGRAALDEELARIRSAWPETDVLVLRPTPQTLTVMRPNPMDPDAAVPTFIKTLGSMRHRLAEPDVWAVLDRHLSRPSRRRAIAGGR